MRMRSFRNPKNDGCGCYKSRRMRELIFDFQNVGWLIFKFEKTDKFTLEKNFSNIEYDTHLTFCHSECTSCELSATAILRNLPVEKIAC